MVELNNLAPAKGAKSARVRRGRGHAAGRGKTGGRGHKGQKSRSGGFHKIGFEGGQMPLQRRVPKFGFVSRRQQYVAELRLHELELIEGGIIDALTVKASGLVRGDNKEVRVIASGEITKAVTVRGIHVTKGAKEAIEKAGGKVEE